MSLGIPQTPCAHGLVAKLVLDRHLGSAAHGMHGAASQPLHRDASASNYEAKNEKISGAMRNMMVAETC